MRYSNVRLFLDKDGELNVDCDVYKYNKPEPKKNSFWFKLKAFIKGKINK
tara:strand:+ start:33 stop:182 length:150 start_codon:yes stop_codon:yes gene_type:complete